MSQKIYAKRYTTRFSIKYTRVIVMLVTNGNVEKVGEDDPANY